MPTSFDAFFTTDTIISRLISTNNNLLSIRANLLPTLSSIQSLNVGTRAVLDSHLISHGVTVADFDVLVAMLDTVMTSIGTLTNISNQA